MAIKVEVSFGEYLDKLTILQIKSERIKDPNKLINVNRELELLQTTWQKKLTTTAKPFKPIYQL